MVLEKNKSAGQLDLFLEQAGPSRRIWPVRELVEQARQLVEQRFADLWVEGEISNLRAAPSGHLYFTLKDAEAQLPVVLFRRQALLLRFAAADGLHVLVRGRVSVYEQRGQLQLVAETMEPVGAGSLQLAFEQLREKLRGEGLFDADRKRPIPAFPRAVGIITSPTGAVIRDFLKVAGRRHAALNVLLSPVTVQGESSAAEIEAAIAALNASGLVDLIVVARGGGSLEDIAPFNSERVARAIATSGVPVVSAVGHETDFTIADFVADLRAPTPSAAAELITEAQYRVADRVEEQAVRLERAMRYLGLLARRRLDAIQTDRMESRMTAAFRRLGQRLDDAGFRMQSAMVRVMEGNRRLLADLAGEVALYDPRQRLQRARQRLGFAGMQLEHGMSRSLTSLATLRHELYARLHALSPLSVLERGYALVQGPDGALISSCAQLGAGDLVTTRLHHGSFASRVENLQPASATRKPKSQKK
ncbi:MAG TPA: exodeoxyribonuclease VII large subunit [Terracidiphilus sp.]|nr:exodeoxyribonuclease VII large subunit [Terracidiphilus sp.]